MFNIFKKKNEIEQHEPVIIRATMSGKVRSYVIPSSVHNQFFDEGWK